MEFTSRNELLAHYAAVKARIAQAAEQRAIDAFRIESHPKTRPFAGKAYAEPEPEPEPDPEPPQNLLAGAPLGRARGLLEPVLQRHMLTWRQVISKDRKQAIVSARQECMWVLNKAGMSLPMIGRFMNRDHTTVLHGVRTHEHKRTS